MEERGDVETPTVLTPEADKLKRTAVHQVGLFPPEAGLFEPHPPSNPWIRS